MRIPKSLKQCWKYRVSALFMGLVLFRLSVQAADPVPVPPREHPRLFLRSADVPEILRNCSSQEMARVWGVVQTMSKGTISSKTLSTTYNEDDMKGIQTKALMYVLLKDSSRGKEAVNAVNSLVQVTSEKDSAGRLTSTAKNYFKDGTRDIGFFMTTLAMVYDWCYPLMTSAERTRAIAWVKLRGKEMEIGYPPLKQDSMVSHGAEAQLMRDYLSAGVAMYHEDREIYNYAAERFFKDYVPARNWWYASHMWHQGDFYGPFRFQWDMFAAWIFRRMGAGDVFSKDQSQVLYYWMYGRRPDGRLTHEGDSLVSSQWTLNNKNRQRQYMISSYQTYLLAANYYPDPFTKKEANRQLSLKGKYDVFYILFNNPNISKSSPNSLPLSRYFGSPRGTMIARTGWTEGVDMTSKDVVALMKVGEYQMGNHDHSDAGNFQIYYKGGFATDSSVYGSGTYGTTGHYSYGRRTISSNGMLLLDPSETFSGAKSNDGGQLAALDPRDGAGFDAFMRQKRHVANVLGHSIGGGNDAIRPDYTYLKGDLTQAYSSKKMSSYNRSFVFLNMKDDVHPAALVVFDRMVSKNASFGKYWILHGAEKPQINGIQSTFARTFNAYNGKLVNTTLLPESRNLKINLVGGPGQEAYVFGKDFYIKPWNLGKGDESIGWRIEVSPRTASYEDLFLNVMQVMDNNSSIPALSVQKFESNEFVGSFINNRLVLFSKSGGRMESDFNISVSSNQTRVLITDVQEGNWNIYLGRTKVGSYSVKPEEGTLYFTANKGDYTFQLGGQSSASISSTPVRVNQSPTVNLSVSSSGDAPATVNLKATASDSDGAVSSVKFYNGSTLLATDSTSGYGYNWKNVPAGTYNLTAVATDNEGAATTSNVIILKVSPANVPPSVSLSGTVSGPAPATVTLKATATDSDGAVSLVKFYNGSTLLGTDSTSDYGYVWTNVSAGTYNLTAKATDNQGAETTSQSITLMVKENIAPSVRITSPIEGETVVSAPLRSLPVSIEVSDTDGSVQGVDFYMDGKWIGHKSEAPFTHYMKDAINQAGVGTHQLWAVAKDDFGSTTESSKITFKLRKPRVLFISGERQVLREGDMAAKNRLEQIGFEVEVVRSKSVQLSDANGRELIVISSDLMSEELAADFKAVQVPIFTWEAFLLDDLGMTGKTLSNDYGVLDTNQTGLVLEKTGSLDAGLSGRINLYAQKGKMYYGVPNSNARNVVTFGDGTTRSLMFAYDQGTVMPGLTAPARRVFFYPSELDYLGLTDQGWRLFDAAIHWASGF